MDEREKMLQGKWYDATNQELIKQRLHQNLFVASDAIFLSNYLLELTAVAHR